MELNLADLLGVLFQLADHAVLKLGGSLAILRGGHVPYSGDEVFAAAGDDPVTVRGPANARDHLLVLSNLVRNGNFEDF